MTRHDEIAELIDRSMLTYARGQLKKDSYLIEVEELSPSELTESEKDYFGITSFTIYQGF